MRDRLERAKEARLRTQKLGGKSLGELLADEEMDSAAAWVLKSRTQEETRKVKRKQMRKQGGNKGVIDAQVRTRTSNDSRLTGSPPRACSMHSRAHSG
eukprot:1738772-Pleurochrysis_carterae.AAC.2